MYEMVTAVHGFPAASTGLALCAATRSDEYSVSQELLIAVYHLAD